MGLHFLLPIFAAAAAFSLSVPFGRQATIPPGSNLCSQLQQMTQVCYAQSGYGDEKTLSEKVEGLSERVSDLQKLMTWYKASDGRYYKVIEKLFSYPIAPCRDQGAIIASAGVRDPYVRRELRNLVKQTGKDTWVGLNDIQREGKYVWVDGVASRDEDELNWAQGQPSDPTGFEDCVHFSAENDWNLSVRDCSAKMYALCQKHERKEVDWQTASNGRSYKVFLERVSYYTAKTKCKEQGAALASAGVRDDNIRVTELRDLVRPANDYVWVGLNDIEEEGKWVWEDGVVAESDNLDWAPGQPSNSYGGEDCAHFWPENLLELNDLPCNTRVPYLCEKTPPDATETPSDWKILSNGMRYKVFMETKTYWNAKETCEDSGGILASVGVRDPTVREELRNMVQEKGYVWVGLNDVQVEGTWLWEDGVISKSGDIDWAPKEPSNSYGGEDCVHFWPEHDLKFNDLACYTKIRFLCEKS